MATSDKTLANYIPVMIARRLAENPGLLLEPAAKYISAAILVVRMSGLIEVTDRFSNPDTDQPAESADSDQIVTLFQTNFEKIIDILTAHGGDLIELTGEMLVAIWPVQATKDIHDTLILRAVQCGLDLQYSLHNSQIIEDENLSLRLVVGLGDVLTTDLGGVFGRWEFLITGKPIAYLKKLSQEVEPGTLALSPEAWKLIQSRSSGTPLPNGCVQLITIDTPVAPISLDLPTLTSRAEAALRGYVPGALLARFGSFEDDVFSELLPITSLFIRLPDFNFNTPMHKIQPIVRALQNVLYDHEGSVDQIRIDDDQVYFTAAFGLPPVAHDDDAFIGLQTAMAIQEELQGLKLQATIGVTTGNTFCGVLGNKLRRAYTMVSKSVKLAEQIARDERHQAVNFSVSVFCDEATYLATKHKVRFEAYPVTNLAKSPHAKTLYRPLLV